MDDAHFTDGIDTPERLVLGLGAEQLAVVVCGALAAYAITRSPLPPAVAVPVALSVAASAAALGWLQLAGRPSLEWALFCARFAVRPREGSLLFTTPALAPPKRAAPTPDEDVAAQPSEVIPLFRTAEPRARSCRRVVLFSCKGGVGRTTLAVELALRIAADGRLRVALVDLDSRGPSVGIRLGVPRPAPGRVPQDGLARPVRVVLRGGLTVLPWVLEPGNSLPNPGATAALYERLALDGFDVVITDIAAGLGQPADTALDLAGEVLLVVVPSVTGAWDAYRSAALLRTRDGHRPVSLVVNRAGRGVDMAEVVADLRLPVAEVPEDIALSDLDPGAGGVAAAAAALDRLAAALVTRAR